MGIFHKRCNLVCERINAPIRIIISVAVICIISPHANAAAVKYSIANGGIEVSFQSKSRTIQICEAEAGIILQNGVISVDGCDISTNNKKLPCKVTVDTSIPELRIELAKLLTARVQIGDNGLVWITAEGKFQGDLSFQADSIPGKAAINVFLENQRKNDRGVLFTAVGPADIGGAKSLFYPDYDLAITAYATKDIKWGWAGSNWRLNTSASAGQNLLLMQFYRHYYRDKLGIKYYAPLKKRSYWETAPVVAMTWYGILKSPVWKINFGQRKEWLFPQIDWISEHLLPYAGRMVFQLDDNYAQNDDVYMRDISDYIRSKGLIPGIWLTPFSVAPEKVLSEHPDYFLYDPNGRLNTTFGSYSYGWWGQYSCFGGTLNVNNKEAVENWFGMWWKKVSETWNFDFFKIDGTPDTGSAYNQALQGGGLDGARLGIKIARSIIGEDKFINACQGPSFNAIGLVQGSRIGGDIGYEKHALYFVIRFNYLNNIVWWCDPDAAAMLCESTVERARLNAQARVLTGQQFLTDDIWTQVPPEICRVWQLSFPMLDIRPVGLYQIEDWERYNVFDLKIARPWRKWDVAGLFNFHEKPVRKVLDLSRLKLEADSVHVFEFWSSTYLGRFDRSVKITRSLKPLQGEVFSIVPADNNHPVLLSTSRHITQGALDIENIKWERSKNGWIVKGQSTHLVEGDKYEMVFFSDKFRIDKVNVSNSAANVKAEEGDVIRVSFVPGKTGSADWDISFVPKDNTSK